ncbi:MAG: hypothetical protein RL685_6979 [Pseudomonadota bacterium]|jgi:hypothetical protein
MADLAPKNSQTASSIPEPSPQASRLGALALRACCVGLVLLGVLLGPWLTAASAQTEPPLRVLILEGPGAEWLRRVRGQLSDLPVTIVTLPLVVQGQAEADVVRQLGPLATNRDAALVAWLMTDGARYDSSASEDTRVAIWFARSGRLFTRRLGARWQQLSRADRSGVLEIGALSVRSAARSLLLDPSQVEPESSAARAASAPPATPGAAARGAEAPRSEDARRSPEAQRSEDAQRNQDAQRSAETQRQAAPSSAERGAAERSSAAELPAVLEPDEGHIVTSPRVALDPTPTPPDRDSEAAGSGGGALDLHWSAELGLSGQLAGPPGYATASIAAGVRALSGRWALGLLGRWGLPLRSELGPSELQLQRHAVLVEAQYLGWSWGALELGPLVRGGLALARRETLSGPAALTASGVAWHPAAQLGAGALAQYRWGTHWGASLRGVLHWLPSPTGYSLVDDLGDPIASAQPWAVQPSLELNASWHW